MFQNDQIVTESRQNIIGLVFPGVMYAGLVTIIILQSDRLYATGMICVISEVFNRIQNSRKE